MSDKKHAPEQKKTEAAPAHPQKGGTVTAIHCTAQGCKKPDQRFGFCTEHYDHFKFGLIKKDGKPVSDYEKKFGHYQKYLDSQKTKKVA